MTEKHEGRETVLVVDDDRAVRRVTVKALERESYRVLEADGGASALALARSHDGPIHLLLTDIVMPEMNGRELSEALTRERPDTRILFMTAYTEDEVILRGVGAAEVTLLSKPFTIDDLIGVVRRVLDAGS